MKSILCLITPVVIGMVLLASCNGGTKSPGSTAAKTDSTPMAYKASYSSSFTISDSAKNMSEVLQSYKDWEDNKMANGSAYFADTISWDNSYGGHLTLKRDSMIHYWQKFRDSLTSSKIDLISAVNLHSTDKNADWVSVWYKQTDTYKTGKVDSNFYNDVNNIVKGKIVYVTSFKQALKKR